MTGFQVLSILIFFGGVQGLVLAMALNRVKAGNPEANRLLAVFILLISLVLFSRLIYVAEVQTWMNFPHLFLIPDIPLFFYGPLFYLYLRRLFNDFPAVKYHIWLHFTPAIIHLTILTLYFFESKEKYLNRILHGNLWEVPYAGLASLLQMAIYLAIGFAWIKKNKVIKGSEKYFNTFFLLMLIAWLTWLYSLLSDIIPSIPSVAIFSYNIAWVALSFITFILAYFAMSQTLIFSMPTLGKKYQGSILTKEKLDLMEQQLKLFMPANKPYLEPTLTRNELAQQLQIHPKALSQLINERFGMNFFDFINGYRVAEFMNLLDQKEYQNFTLLAIAFESGFNSKTTFNAAFKKCTGLTPIQYRKQ